MIKYKKSIKDKIKNFITKKIAKRSRWAIGLYNSSLDNLFNPKPSPNNPILTYKDITDCNASFVADPFLVKEGNIIYCFFEIKDRTLNRGVIGVATSKDGKNFNYQKIVLREDFHLSYPAIYKVDNQYYMLPEIGESREIRIYKAVNFPYEWELDKVLLRGKYWADATLYFHKNIWYLFVSTNKHDSLEIYYSKEINGNYLPHKQNPIYTNNPKTSRLGGIIFDYQNHIYRTAQECTTEYGEALYLLEIEELTPTIFREKMVKILFAPQSGLKWNAKKMHHFSFVKYQDRYIITTDAEGYKLSIHSLSL